MPTRRMKLHRMSRTLRMRSRDNLIHLRETRLRPMGVNSFPALLAVPILLGLIILIGWLRLPATVQKGYRPIEEAFVNPMAGWAVRADTWGGDNRLEVSLIYAEATWAELEPEEGKYAFGEFEEKNHLDEWWAEEKRLILRIICDRPGEMGHKDIPEWLVKKMGGDILAGSYYETDAGSGFAPDYSSLIMREAHRKLIAALAQRYDGHPGVAYIELGTLGIDGEWTVDLSNEETLRLPVSMVSREYAWHYTSSFENTLMLMRRPYKEAQLLSVGLYNPDLGNSEATWAFLESIEWGGYDHQIETDLVPMPGFQSLSPSGAHLSEEVDIKALLEERWFELARLITESRLSYAVIHQNTAPLDDKTIRQIQEMDALIGYRLWLRSAQWDTRLRAGIRSKVELVFRNDGIAPLHDGWPVALALFDGEEMICRQSTEADTAMMLSGDSELTAWIDLPSDLDVGVYTLKLAILDPADGEPGLRLANVECDEETLWMELGELRVVGGWMQF